MKWSESGDEVTLSGVEYHELVAHRVFERVARRILADKFYLPNPQRRLDPHDDIVTEALNKFEERCRED